MNIFTIIGKVACKDISRQQRNR